MSTERLYFADAYRKSFAARVVAHGRWQKAPSLILDRTCYYPEAGGQLGDRGTLAGLPVVDTQVDDAGVIHHVLADGGALPEVGAEVAGELDWARRRQHMAQHTAQHLLSGALLDRAAAATAST
jgi:alanyl-tRNA synthetase